MPHRRQVRMTKQRQIILDTLRKTCTHPTADELYHKVRKTLPHISLGTVYRNLETLNNMGLITRLLFGGGQMRFDGNIETHHHVSCRYCNRIEDIPEDAVTTLAISPDAMEGFSMLGHELYFVGVCNSCKEKKEQRVEMR